MKIACIGYREWALKIYEELKNKTTHQFLIISSESEYSEKKIIDFQPNLVLFYGWSKIVSNNIIDKYKCVMLHPSPLPKYRGGTPIQNQIIRGEKDSAVTLFFMNKNLDAGDIIAQEKISLDGHMSEILNRIISTGITLSFKLLNNDYTLKKQNDSEATYYGRLKEKDNEITLEELQTKDSEYLYNKIRMLEEPYPNAYIKTIDGKKLYITYAKISNK